MARPTIRTRTGAGVSTVVAEPILSFPAVAAPRSITTSCRPRGARPAASRYGVSAGSAIQLPADLGGPSPPTALPSEPSSSAAPVMDGWAPATPGTARTVASSEPGIGGRAARTPLPTAPELRTTTPMPDVAGPDEAGPSREALSVSPRVRAPARNATPSPIAATTPARRRWCARRCLMVTDRITPPRRAA